MFKVTVHHATRNCKPIAIEGHSTCKRATAYKSEHAGWKINMDDGATIGSLTLRGIETVVTDYLKGSVK